MLVGAALAIYPPKIEEGMISTLQRKERFDEDVLGIKYAIAAKIIIYISIRSAPEIDPHRSASCEPFFFTALNPAKNAEAYKKKKLNG